MSDQHHAIRKAITDSYYDVRNEGGTMEDAADRATAAVVAALCTTHPTERKEWRCAPGEHIWQRFPQISDGIVCAKCGADQEDTDA